MFSDRPGDIIRLPLVSSDAMVLFRQLLGNYKNNFVGSGKQSLGVNDYFVKDCLQTWFIMQNS